MRDRIVLMEGAIVGEIRQLTIVRNYPQLVAAHLLTLNFFSHRDRVYQYFFLHLICIWGHKLKLFQA